MDEEVANRFEFVDDRFNHYKERIEALESYRAEQENAEETEDASRKNSLVNAAMIALFILEVIIGAMQLIWTFRHA